jgi:hypothetical protein
VGAGGVGGPASGLGVLPGAGFGRPGVPGDYGYGTHYGGWGGYGAAEGAYVAAANTYPYYGTSMYAGYPGAWPATGMAGASMYNNPGYGATAGQLGMAAQPTPYDYGGNVVVQPDQVYVNGDAVGTPEQYAGQATQIATTGQSAQPAQDSKWLPLGVFAVVEGDATDSDDVFQLAVNPDGIIRGNYHNRKANQVQQINGAVDKTSMRAAWTIGNNQTPVYEAGIANLTKNSTPILVHTGGGQSHQMSLIRLQPPQQSSNGPAPGGQQ